MLLIALTEIYTHNLVQLKERTNMFNFLLDINILRQKTYPQRTYSHRYIDQYQNQACNYEAELKNQNRNIIIDANQSVGTRSTQVQQYRTRRHDETIRAAAKIYRQD